MGFCRDSMGFYLGFIGILWASTGILQGFYGDVMGYGDSIGFYLESMRIL